MAWELLTLMLGPNLGLGGSLGYPVILMCSREREPLSWERLYLWSSVCWGDGNRYSVTGTAALSHPQLLVFVTFCHLLGSPVLDLASVLPGPQTGHRYIH